MTQPSQLFKGRLLIVGLYCWVKWLSVSSWRRPWFLFVISGVGCWGRASAATPRRPWSPRSAQRAAMWRRASARCATPSKLAPSLTWQRSTRTPAQSSSEVRAASLNCTPELSHSRIWALSIPQWSRWYFTTVPRLFLFPLPSHCGPFISFCLWMWTSAPLSISVSLLIRSALRPSHIASCPSIHPSPPHSPPSSIKAWP